jgi:hypothetical protein
MAQPFYTPVGEMDKPIDIWEKHVDRDSSTGDEVPDTLFAADIRAKIETLWSTSQPERLVGQILPEVSHRITIQYVPGLKEQMYAIYHHPDNGDMRLDFAQVGDPDFNRVEVKILAIARGNAQ